LFSNHGGRQVDTAPPAIECLTDIVKVVNGRIEGKFILMIIFDIM
jgi:isopentenyl diphosphate isomerase/L-lactate dehydrogenase-like FMN-dependent dehydrogenase